jgi:hypothetical protein
LNIQPAAGGAVLSITAPAGSSANTFMNKGGSGTFARFQGYNQGNLRWVVNFGDNTAESGTSTGSDFNIDRYNNSGALIDEPFRITRANGVISLGNITNGGVDNATYEVNMRLTGGGSGGFYIKNTAAGIAGFPFTFANSAGTTVGSINFSDTATTYATTSDLRLKTDIEPFVDGREIINKLEIKQFTWSETGTQDIGVIAQQAQEVFPQAVVEGEGEVGDLNFTPWGVDYSKYVPVLIEALQDAHKRIDELERRVLQLEQA